MLLVAVLLTNCVSKTETKKETVVVQQKTQKLIGETENQAISNQKNEESQKKTFEVEDKNGFIYYPYDFPLDEGVIKALLDNNVEIKKEFVAKSEYADAYTFITITRGDTELSFYDYEGKHQARITTAKLPLQNGIKIGMHKTDFLTEMKFTEESAKAVSTYSLWNEYGEFSFYFRKDTLYLINGYYEEGD